MKLKKETKSVKIDEEIKQKQRNGLMKQRRNQVRKQFMIKEIVETLKDLGGDAHSLNGFSSGIC